MVKITKAEIEALIGRSLSDLENANFALYLDLAKAQFKDLLCWCDDYICYEPNAELKLLLARLFGAIEAEQKFDSNIESKQVEDFQVDYCDNPDSPMAQAIRKSSGIIAKYSRCRGGIMHGKTLLR